MLRGRCPDVAIPFSHSHERISTIRIVDDIGTTSRSEHFVAPKGTAVCGDFVDALLRPLPRMSLRLIIVHFSRVQDLNFAYIDALGSALDIDPSFLITHFDRSRARHGNWLRRRAPSMLPLESRHLQFCYASFGHTTLTRFTFGSLQNEIGSYWIQ